MLNPAAGGTIEFVKRVVFSDLAGTELKVYEIGDRETFTAKDGIKFITPMGGIYDDEAIEVVATRRRRSNASL